MTLPLAGLGFDRAAHRRTDELWLAQAWQRGRVLELTSEGAARVGADGLLEYVAGPDSAQATPRRFLGVIEGIPYFTTTLASSTAKDAFLTLRDIGRAQDEDGGGLFATALALERWHQRHVRCAVCGEVTYESHAGWTRSCLDCGATHFPRTDPAVIMLITRDGGERALLGRGPTWPAGRMSTLAGFVEPGESFEAAVAREIHEEVGVRVTDFRYVASQPWPFPSSLMIGYYARLDGDGELRCDPEEIAEANWFTREEVRAAAEGRAPESAQLQALPPVMAISRYLIDGWLNETY